MLYYLESESGPFIVLTSDNLNAERIRLNVKCNVESQSSCRMQGLKMGEWMEECILWRWCEGLQCGQFLLFGSPHPTPPLAEVMYHL